jgi:hypothetical protein
MNSEARALAERYAEGLRPRQVVAYNAKTGAVCVFKFGPNRKEESLQAVGWKIVHRYTPKSVKTAVQPVTPAPVEIFEHPDEPRTSPNITLPKDPAKRGRPFSKPDKA